MSKAPEKANIKPQRVKGNGGIYIMGLAEQVYNNNKIKRNKNRTESPDDKAYRLARMYNNILRNIEMVSDAKTFLQVRNEISAYAHEAGKESVDVARLRSKLNERIKKVTTELDDSINALNAEIDKIKGDKFEESSEQLQELITQAEHRTLHFLMQMGNNNDGGVGNRRRAGNFVANADRADAIALMKIASLPQYAQCFSSKQKQIILEKSKNPAEIVFERNKEPLLQEKHSELGKAYMKSLNLRNALKKIGNTEKAYYFNEDTEITYKDPETNERICEVRDFPKTEAGDRYLIIPDSAIAILDDILTQSASGEYLFSEHGKRIRSNAFNRRLTRVCDDLHIKHRSMHKIRKTYGTTLLDADVDESIVAEQMGHSDIATTKRFYYRSNKNDNTKFEQISKALSC